MLSRTSHFGVTGKDAISTSPEPPERTLPISSLCRVGETLTIFSNHVLTRSVVEDESGWVWFIPLHNDTVSVGVVLHQDIYSRKRKELRENSDDSSLEALYHSTLDNYAPDIKALLGEGELQESDDGAAVKQASDFSYNAPRHAGPGYRVIGDAGGMLLSAYFVPFFLISVFF
jgi:flavin-dependent dehydrogenase